MPIVSAEQMIRNGAFNDGIDGWWTTGGSVSTQDNQACMDIELKT
ncbi:hypothetical protein [Vibrio sp. DW001]|nr:hypothetical protein [Vibrio sp. DW001]